VSGHDVRVKRKDGYAPIESYAAIGDGRTTALVALDGSIDFLSLPAMHCPTTFGALLDEEKGGRFVLQPAGRFDSERRYLDRSNVLETTYRTKTGVVRVTEALTLQDGALLPWLEISRRVEGRSGEVPMRWSVEPRFRWGQVEPRIVRRGGVPVAEGAGLTLGVHSFDAGEPEVAGRAIGGEFTARAGSSSLLTVCCTEGQPIPVPLRADAERRLDGTIDSWRRWLGAWDYDGPWEDAIARSALALKLLVYAPRGAIVAAPTTSLPERIGGDKNYDYRYMWVRDASFTLEAFLRLGLPEQVHESFSCLLKSVRTTAPDIHPFYTAEGEIARRCDELPLAGYRGSQPVRYGNAASRQLQLGSWGDLLEMTDLYVRNGNALDEATGAMLAACLDRLCVSWVDEDSGIWELDDLRQYTSSLLGAWMAFERGIGLAESGELPVEHLERWRDERAGVRAFIEERCWSEEVGSYVEAGGEAGLDAAVLRGARMGWHRISPERFVRSVDTIRRELDAGDALLYRTTREAGNEGAFVACSFWLAEALARTGRVEEAVGVFEQLLGYANDVGLLPEQIDPAHGAFLGNFPQGLSHLALVNAAGAIWDARGAGASATARAAGC
jgi:GH15 family glucan-1,4-alpha-glucosidase